MSNSPDGGWMNGYEAVDHAVDAVERAWGRLLSFGDRAWRIFGMDVKLQWAKQYAMDHPVLTLCGLITTCMCSIPIMCFMFFAMGTLFFTFLGFLFIEGFLLTFASIVLGGALFIVGLMSVGTGSFLALAWYMISASSGFISRARNKFTGGAKANDAQIAQLHARHHSHEHGNGECLKDRGTEKED